MRKLIFVLFFFSLSPFSFFSQTTGDYSVYLIGDAGEDTVPGKALLMLKEELLKNAKSTVVFLGDNVYPDGLIANNKSSVKHLESQLSILKECKGKVFFIPGNHDWEAQRRNGLEVLKNEELYVKDYLKNKTTVENRNEKTFLPENGLPGPNSVMLNDKLRLIVLDTQWFLNYYRKNKIRTKAYTKQLFYSQLDSLLNYSKQNNEQVIITAHHPIFTNGQHSKSKQPFRFLINCTPFQLFGLLGINRLYSQDIAQPRYRRMRKKLLGIFSKYDNIMYASGHDHNVQCFDEGKVKYIVSGNGSKLSKLRNRRKFESLFQDDSKTGFVKLKYDSKGNHKTEIYRVGEELKELEGF